MKQLTHSAKYLQQRKFFVVLPVLVFPFLTFFLWSLGLIGATTTQSQKSTQIGFNSDLPAALPSKDSSWNKLKFYEQADKDSAKFKTLQRNDPNYSLSLSKPTNPVFADTFSSLQYGNNSKRLFDPYPTALQIAKDPNEEKVYKKLAQLNSELDKSKETSSSKYSDTNHIAKGPAINATGSDEINRLEDMMQTKFENNNESDPEMKQINEMLEKVLDIQHPERITDKLKKQSETHTQQVFPVIAKGKNVSVSLLQGKQIDSSSKQIKLNNSFYSMEDVSTETDNVKNAISAVIPETQTLVPGSTVKLMLTNEVFINGLLIPKNEFIYGIAALDGERLTISIATIQYQNNILPVALKVYDQDGLNGIYVPGAITRDVSKQSTEQAIQGIGLASLDPSIGAQAASAGIQAAKSLIGKKVKQVKVRVKAGYRVLLRDENQKNK